MARLGNDAGLDGGKNSAAFLFGVGALGIATLPDVGRELPKGQGEILFFKEVKAFKIKHCKAGRVCQVSAIILIGKRIELGNTRSVFAALNAATNLSRLQLQLWEQTV